MFEILLEDNHCLAINKPAGLLSQGDATGDPSVVDLAADYLRSAYAKPGNVYVGLVHRLDRPTSGVLLLARTSKAAARLSDQFRNGQVTKNYIALAEGNWPDDAGVWEDWLAKDRLTNVVSITAPGRNDSRRARLSYRVIGRGPRIVTFELTPTTGRGHQLRVQLASRGLPIVGDRKYGASSILQTIDGHSRIALHARCLKLRHPTRPETLEIEAPFPADWPVGGLIGTR